jgi:hypothetical protein
VEQEWSIKPPLSEKKITKHVSKRKSSELTTHLVPSMKVEGSLMKYLNTKESTAKMLIHK